MWKTVLFALSSTAPITESQANYLIWGAIGVLFLGGISATKGVLDIIRFFRADPPSDVRFASKSELAEIRKEIAAVEHRINSALHEFTESQKEIFVEIRSIHRSLGRIEGQTKI